MPAVWDTTSALGSMYVMEGSTVGGQIISRHLESALGPCGGRGYSYFRPYGAEVGRRWREFGAVVESHVDRPGRERVVAAANETFEALHDWFAMELAGKQAG